MSERKERGYSYDVSVTDLPSNKVKKRKLYCQIQNREFFDLLTTERVPYSQRVCVEMPVSRKGKAGKYRKKRKTFRKKYKKRKRSFSKKRSSKRPFTKQQVVAIKKMINHDMEDPYKSRTLQSVKWSSPENYANFHSITHGSLFDWKNQTDKFLRSERDDVSGEYDYKASNEFFGVLDTEVIRNQKIKVCNRRIITRMRNNSGHTLTVDMWKLYVKKAVSKFPKDLLMRGLENEALGATDTTRLVEDVANSTVDKFSPQYFPQHSDLFREHFGLSGHVRRILNPGDEVVYKLKFKDLIYKTETILNETILERLLPSYFVGAFFRTLGGIGHSSTNDAEIGYVASDLDVVYEINYDFQLHNNKGRTVTRYYSKNDLDALTTPVQVNLDMDGVDENGN